MKKAFRILSCFVCVLFIAALVLTGCNFGIIPQSTTPTNNETEDNSPNESHGKQIPVYQGMSISTSLGVTMPSFEGQGNNGNGNGNGNTDNNGNHNGWYKGDSADNQGDVDQETPFPDADENIEQEIKDSLEVIGSKQDIYYANQNQNIYIHIYISNPDQFEILSFTLNGQKYSSYMFESGSTQELLILKLNVGDAHGIVDYTIDQIKYIDGTEIKDVKIGGDQTVKAGIRTEDQVTANVTDLQIGTNSIFFNATVTDRDNLIAYNNGVIKAVLFNGEALVAEKELTLGANTVAFDNLTNGTVYQYAIVACYDNLTGDEIGFHILAKEALQTNNIVLFDNIVIGQDSINFTFKWDDSVSNKVLTGLNLYKNGEFVTALGVDALTATQLLSANEYVLVAEYQDLGQPATISLTFATLEKGVPGIFITNTSATQTGIAFDIEKSDIDSVGAITKIELVHANGTVVADNVDVRNFENLLSNNAYTVKVTYTYDLNDGNGEQTITAETKITTDAKTAPQFVISNEKATAGNITADFTFTDVDSVLASYKVELYKGETLIAQNAENVINFTGLDYLVDYTITITYTYDLNDGKGVQTTIYSKNIRTASSGFAYIVDTNRNTCTITGIGTCTDTIIAIPSYIDGYRVTAIGENAFKDCTSIISIIIANGIDAIGKRAFAGCTALTECTIPESIWEIGIQIFQGCTNLKTVYYNSRYNNYENRFLSNVKSLETIIFGGNCVPSYIAIGATSLKTVIILEGVTEIGHVAFEGCTNLTSVTIANSVTNFVGGTFKDCTALTNVILPQNLQRIAADMFSGCTNLTSIIIPNDVTIIDGGAFQNCTALTSVTLPQALERIEASAFDGCSNLQSILIDADNEGFCAIDGILYNKDITEIIRVPEGVLSNVSIPDTVITIGKRAFANCKNITNVFIPQSVAEIGNDAFNGCDNITSYTGPIEGLMFNRDQLTTLVLTNGAKIEDWMFSHNNVLESIALPGTVEKIGDYAFYYCSNLKTIIYNGTKDDWNAISKGSFWNEGIIVTYATCSDGIICLIHTEEIDEAIAPTCISTGLTEGKHCSVCNEFLVAQEIVPATGIHNYESVVTPPTATENGMKEYTCPDCGDSYTETLALTDFTVTSSNCTWIGYTGEVGENLVIPSIFEHDGTWYIVTSIGDYAFYWLENLSSVTLPESVTSIGDSAFSNCSNLTSFIIPESVTNIGNSAFSYSTGLKDVYFCSPTPPAMGHDVFGYVWDYDDFSIHVPEASYDLYTKINDGGLWQDWACPRMRKWNGWCFHTYEGEVTAPTKTTEGYTTNICTVCGNSYRYNYVPAIGSEGLAYELNDNGGITITGLGTCTDTEIYIPEMIDGYTVTAIAQKAFAENITITYIKVANTVNTIGTRAFYKCTALEEIFIPESVWEIGTQIFQGCSNLTTVYYNGTYGSSENPFLCVPSIKTVVFGGSHIPSFVAYSASNIKSIVILDKVQSIGNRAFMYSGVTHVVIPNNVTIIEDGAFFGCGELLSVVVSGNITVIESEAFRDCTSLTAFNFPDSITAINFAAFSDCTSLTNITFGGTVEQWNDILFGDFWNSNVPATVVTCIDGILCLTHTEVIDEAVAPTCTKAGRTEGKHCSVCGMIFVGQESIPANGHNYEGDFCSVCGCDFSTEGLEFTLNDDGVSYSVTGIGTCADTELVIPAEHEGLPVTAIGKFAFSKCKTLTSVKIPDSVVEIQHYAFQQCILLTNVTIPNSVVTISYNAFEGCTSLANITIPNSVETIGDNAFQNCTALTSFILPNSVISIGRRAFDGCTSLSYNVYDNAYYLGSQDNPYYALLLATSTDITSCVTHADTKIICGGAFYECTNLTDVTIVDEVKGIGNYAFHGCSAIPTIVLPSNLKFMGNYVFQKCAALESIVIPEGIKKLNDYSFAGCESLASIVLPEGLTAIGGYVFRDCISLTSITIPQSVNSLAGYAFYNCSALTGIVIPAGVPFIGAYTFHGCAALYHVEIPESVTRIGNYAFRSCYALKELIYAGTIAQWKAIEFGKDWQVNVSVYTKVTCSDGAAPIR